MTRRCAAAFLLLSMSLGGRSMGGDELPAFATLPARHAAAVYAAQAAKAEEEYRAAMLRARVEYAKSLGEALVTAVKAGQTTEAQLILAEKGRVEAVAVAEKQAVPDDMRQRLLTGEWHRVTPGEGEPTLVAEFLPNGTLRPKNRSTSFTAWEFRDGTLTLRNPQGKPNGDGMEFIAIHERVLVPRTGAKHRHVWLAP